MAECNRSGLYQPSMKMKTENRKASLRASSERIPLDQFTFQRGEKRLADRVFITVALRSHRGSNAFSPAALAKVVCSAGPPLIGVMDRLFRVPLLSGHVECVQHQFGAQVAWHRLADDSPAEGVEHDRQVQVARIGRHVGDVCHPEFVGPGGHEVTIDEVRSRPPPSPPSRRRGPLSAANSLQTRRFHQAMGALFADADALGPKLRACPTVPVGTSRSAQVFP